MIRTASPALIVEHQTQVPDKALLQAKLHESSARRIKRTLKSGCTRVGAMVQASTTLAGTTSSRICSGCLMESVIDGAQGNVEAVERYAENASSSLLSVPSAAFVPAKSCFSTTRSSLMVTTRSTIRAHVEHANAEARWKHPLQGRSSELNRGGERRPRRAFTN